MHAAIASCVEIRLPSRGNIGIGQILGRGMVEPSHIKSDCAVGLLQDTVAVGLSFLYRASHVAGIGLGYFQTASKDIHDVRAVGIIKLEYQGIGAIVLRG